MENLFVEDRKLPGLARALNCEEMRAVLAQTLRLRDEVRGFEVRLLKHTPGKRCVIEYRFFMRDAPEHPQRLFAKLYRKERGSAVFENLQSLWRASARAAEGESRFHMPEPLAFLPPMGMVLQRAAPGRQFSCFNPKEDLSAAVRLIAKNLAALHNLNAGCGEIRSLADHMEKYCRPGPQALLAACPEFAPTVNALVAELWREANMLHAPLVPAHGDLNRAQIFIAAEAAYFIDFDGFCVTHAALDLGNFLVTMHTHFGAASATLQKIFLKTYGAHASPEPLAGLRVYQAFAYLRRAMIAFRSQSEAGRRAQVFQLLEQSLAVLKHEADADTAGGF